MLWIFPWLINKIQQTYCSLSLMSWVYSSACEFVHTKSFKKAGFSPIRQCRNEQSRMPLVTPQGRRPRFFTSFAVTPGCFPVPWDRIPAHERSSKRAELADLVHPTSAPSPRAIRPSLAVPSGVVHRKPGDSITKRRGNRILGMVSATTILINGIMLLYCALWFLKGQLKCVRMTH